MSNLAKSGSTSVSVPRLSSQTEIASADGPHDRPSETPLADAFTQIREARDRIVAAIIKRAIDDGCHQRAKWLFDLGGIVPEGHKSMEDQPSLLRLLLDKFQIPESGEDFAAEFSANGPAVE
jgi:hypothetical protein